ncbi:NUDIX hydrolase [Streptomyces sp. DH12]|uniref:NUDIX hydrolase n=1 Tax=Streptomyces sp. DH12 TaxID=2857010 RepID=UPI001E63DA76|nr:NUDIX hydrolase [Streptomyces sp. DH12]
MSTPTPGGAGPDASVIVARDDQGLVALLSAHFPDHGGEYLFLPGGRMEPGETPQQCAHRELKEEAGITASSWRSLGSYAITLSSTARVHLFEAAGLILGPQQLTPSEVDFKLSWWPLEEAIDAASAGRFLLPAGPLALMLTRKADLGRSTPDA